MCGRGFYYTSYKKGSRGSYLFAYRKQIKLTTCASGHPLFDPLQCTHNVILYMIYPRGRCPFFTTPPVALYIDTYVNACSYTQYNIYSKCWSEFDSMVISILITINCNIVTTYWHAFDDQTRYTIIYHYCNIFMFINIL